MKFGVPDHRNETFVQITTKSLALLLPAILLGHYLDESVKWIQVRNKLGRHVGSYVAAQVLLNTTLIYVVHKVNYGYANEFQMTFAGLFFSALFFGMQVNFISNLKKLLASS